MADSHGSKTVVILNGVDISQYCDNSDNKRGADEHDKTTYGKNSHVVRGGLKNGSSTLSGIYDTTAGTGPRAVINPLIGSNVTYIQRVEGTGVGKPQDSVQVHVKSYVETRPVADLVRWSAELTYSDDVTSTTQ
jgi:hypothetical protein